jgi:hypothetical protein
MDTAVVTARVSSGVLPALVGAEAGAQITRGAAAARGDTAAAPQVGDTVALSDVATSLAGDARELFAAFSGEDRTRLAQLVASGAISAQELGDGLTGALKGSRKLQLWTLVAEKQRDAPPPDLSSAPAGWSKNIAFEMEALSLERGRAMMELARLRFEGAPADMLTERAAALQKLDDRDAQLKGALFWDMTQPMTMIGASGQFFSANWQSEAERSAQDKLDKLGVFSASVKDVLAAAGKKAAQENLIVRQVNRPGVAG